MLSPEKHPKTYLLELVTCSKGKTPNLISDFGHAWIRLISPLGELYSVGFYPDESTRITPEYVPGLTFPGMLLNPDKHDVTDWNECVTRIPLAPQQFQEIRTHIETMQINREQGTLAFRLVDRNCVWFVAEVAALIGVKLDIEYSLTCYLLQVVGSKMKKFPTAKLFVPKRFQQGMKFFKRLIRIFPNSLYYVLGGRVVVNKQWIRTKNGQMKKLSGFPFQPLFGCLGDIFKKSIPLNHVRALQNWQQRYKNSDNVYGQMLSSVKQSAAI